MKDNKVKLVIVLSVLLLFIIAIPYTLAIYKETKSKELNLSITHPSFTVTFNPNQGTVEPTSKTVTYGHNYDELPTPNRTGFQFDGWYDALTGGSKITNSSIVNRAENHSLFAHWIAKELIVNGDTNISLTYSNTSQNANINEASNGTGNYSYVEKSETSGENNTNYITLNGTELTVDGNTPAGTYTYVVTVTDTVSGSTIDVTYTITIGRMKIDLPTCGTFTYNKTEQTLLTSTTEYNVVNNTAINAGNYTVGVTPTSNYEWNDSTTVTKDVSCTINPYDISISGNATVVPTSNKTYNGSSFTPTPAVIVPLPSSMTSYTLTSSEVSYSYANNINAGEATITISGAGNYTGTITQNFTIEKADGYINLSEINKAISYGTSNVTFTITSSHGGTYSVTDNNATATSNVIGTTVTISNLDTIASGTTVEVTVTSGETNNYNAATATYTINISNAILTGGSVTITGNNLVGEYLVANVIDTTPVATYTYEWYTNTSPSTSGGTKITGATSSTYQVSASDTGKYIYVVVTASKPNYTSISFSDLVDSSNNLTETVKNPIAKPTSAYCKNIEYNGNSQVLTNTAGTGFAFYNNSGTNAIQYTVTARLLENYIWNDYTTIDATINCSIAPKTITLTAASSTREYNGLPLTNNNCTSSNLISGDTAICTMTSASTITNVGSQNNVIATYIISNGSGDITSNYYVNTSNGLLTVTIATPTVTLNTKNADNRVYTGSPIVADTATVTLANNETYNGTVTYTYYSDSNCSIDATTVAPTNVGTYYVKATIDAFGNYNTSESNCVNHSILPKKATISIQDSTTTLTYGSNGFNTYTYDGDGTVSCSSSDTTKVTCSIDPINNRINLVSGVSTTSPVTITISAGTGTNYSAADNKTFTVNVNKAIPVVNLTPRTGMIWNNSPQASNTATVTLLNNETYNGSITYTYYTDSNCTTGASLTAPTLAGNHYVKASTESIGNYDVGESNCVIHTIDLLTPTVTLTPLSAVYTGSPIVANNPTVSTPNGGGSVSYQYFTNDTCTTGATTVAPTNVGTYYVIATVQAVANKTTAASSECVSHTITPQSINAVTNLSIAPTGVVSWTNSSNATGYEISIDGINWTSVPAGNNTTSFNYLNVITGATGSRTVYVRAIKSDTTNYVIIDSTTYTNTLVYTVTFNSNDDSYGTVEPSSYNVINGATYTTSGSTLTLQDGRVATGVPINVPRYSTTVDSWTNSSGTISNPTTITANFVRQPKVISITFNSNSGAFEGAATTNTVSYTEIVNNYTKVSHTSNVNSNGVKQSDYGNYWNESNIVGTDRGDTSKAHVITLPGASSLTVDVYYNGEDAEWDWVNIWSGSHPDYTAAANYGLSISGKLGGVQTGTFTVNGNTLTNMGYSTYNINSDSVTFGFSSDSGLVGEGYGYYAVVTGTGIQFQVNSGTYKEPTKTDYAFAGWNTKSDGTGTMYKTEADLIALDESITLFAQYVSTRTICKRATVLHTEQCLRTSSTEYCRGSGYDYNETVTYGNATTTSGVLTPGDAFDCDVNGDGTFDPATERFYYISRYNDNSLVDKEYADRFVDDIAALVYYSNTVNGVPGNTSIPYYLSDGHENYLGPITAITYLPTTSQWSNVSLYKTQRKILTEYGDDSTATGIIPDSFSYAGYAARFITALEIYSGCSNGGQNDITAFYGMPQCQFLNENSMYTDPNNGSYGAWLENPYRNYDFAWHICGEHNHLGQGWVYEYVPDNAVGVRPVIDVPLNNIRY